MVPAFELAHPTSAAALHSLTPQRSVEGIDPQRGGQGGGGGGGRGGQGGGGGGFATTTKAVTKSVIVNALRLDNGIIYDRSPLAANQNRYGVMKEKYWSDKVRGGELFYKLVRCLTQG